MSADSIRYTSQSRDVSARVQMSIQDQSAPNFGLFAAQVMRTEPSLGVTASASQNSVLTPTGIQASGRCYTEYTSPPFGGNVSALSRLTIGFEVLETTPFVLSGQFTRGPFWIDSTYFVQLFGNPNWRIGRDGPSSVSGVLTPGVYSMGAIFGGSTSFRSIAVDITYDFSLTVPAAPTAGMGAGVGGLLLLRRARRHT